MGESTEVSKGMRLLKTVLPATQRKEGKLQEEKSKKANFSGLGASKDLKGQCRSSESDLQGEH